MVSLAILFVVPGEEGGSALGLQRELEPGFHAKKTEHYLKKPLEIGQAIYWNLDWNSYAVKIRGSLLIFDYSNDTPIKRYDYFSEKWVGPLERSLLTGIVEPDEIKDQNVIVFFSHEHPGEMLPTALEWKNKIEKIHYVVSQEVYKAHKEKIDEKGLSELVKVAKPGQTLGISGVTVKVFDSTLSGVEFKIEATGITIYHSGAYGCKICQERMNRETHRIVFSLYSNPRLCEGAMDTHYTIFHSLDKREKELLERVDKIPADARQPLCSELEGNDEVHAELTELERNLIQAKSTKYTFFGIGKTFDKKLGRETEVGFFRGHCAFFNPPPLKIFGTWHLFPGYTADGYPLGEFRD